MLCAVRSGRLQVLVVKSADGKAVLPYVWIGDGGSLDARARELARDIAGSSVAWMMPGAATASQRHPAESALSVPYIGVVSSGAPTPSDAVWCPVDALPALAPRQRTLAEGALGTLRLHMDAFPVAFRFLPPVFTLSDLQQVYELLLGRLLHKASFRRALQSAHLVDPTDEWRSEGRGRPARLFRYQPRKRRGGRRSVRFDFFGN